MNTLKQLGGYIFSSTPGELKLYVPMIIFVGLLFISSIAFHYVYKRHRKDDPAFRKLFKKTASHFLTFGIIFTVHALIRYENIPYFSMRLWFYITAVVLAIFLYKTFKKYRVDYPREKHNVAQIKSIRVNKDDKKYLPNKKKR